MSEGDSVNHDMHQKPSNENGKLQFEYQCQVCHKYCKTEFLLKIHSRCHISYYKTGLYRCHICHLTYTKRHVLNGHIRQAHLPSLNEIHRHESKAPRCMCCKRKFFSLLDLRRHLTSTLSQLSASVRWLTKKDWMLNPQDDCMPSSCLSGSSSVISSESVSSTAMMGVPHVNNSGDIHNNCTLSKTPNDRITGPQYQQINSRKVSTIPFNSYGIQKLSLMRQKSSNEYTSKTQQNSTNLHEVSDRAKIPSENQTIDMSLNLELQPEAAGSHTVDSDCNLGDTEFVSLLHALFEEDSSDEDSDSSEWPTLKNVQMNHEHPNILPDRQKDKLYFDNLIESQSGFTKIDLSEHLENEMMRLFLLSYSFVDRPSGVFKCLPCRSKFSSHAKLLDHFQVHFCLICGTSFQQKYKLSQHLKEHKIQHQSKDTCNMKFNPSFIKDMFEKRTNISDDDGTFTCKMCPKNFPQQSSFFIHMYSHAKNQPYSSPRVVPVMKKTQSQMVDRDATLERQRKHPCPQCGKSFFSRNNLRGHMETHEQTQRFLCSICDKSFRRKRALLKHLDIHMDRGDEREVNLLKQKMNIRIKPKLQAEELTAEKYEKQLASTSGQFIVAACFTPQKLVPEKEKKQEENRERSFSCPVCNKQFFSKRNLRGHMDVHNPDKRFSCSMCSRNFRRKSTLKRHFITHTKSS